MLALKRTKQVMSCSHHIYDLTFISGGGGDKAGKLVTEAEGTVAAWRARRAPKSDIFQRKSQHPSAVFVGIKPGVFNETSGQFPATFMATKSGYLWREVGTSPALFVGTKTAIIRRNLIFSEAVQDCVSEFVSLTPREHDFNICRLTQMIFLAIWVDKS